MAAYLVALNTKAVTRAIPYHLWSIDPAEAERAALDRLF